MSSPFGPLCHCRVRIRLIISVTRYCYGIPLCGLQNRGKSFKFGRIEGAFHRMSLCPFHGRNYCLTVFLSPFLWRLANVSGPSVRIFVKNRKFVFHFDDRHAMQRIEFRNQLYWHSRRKVVRLPNFLCVVFKRRPCNLPIWQGTRPYQQIPFQFSRHRLSATGELDHSEFLDLSGDDPSKPLADALIDAFDQVGPVFVYNASFESARITELADRFPELSHQLLGIK